MAGDWIKVESVTPDKPEVISMAEILGIDQDAVAGKLVRLWVWADQQTFDGNAGGNGVSVTKSFLDRCTCVTGFADAMEKVGWLTTRDGKLTFPNFDRHNGQTAKQRALTSKRVAKCKGKSNAKGNGASVTLVLPREEKRREEDNTPIAPKGANAANVGYCQAFEDWWQAYPRKEAKGNADRAWKKAGKKIKASKDISSKDAVEFLLERVKVYAASPRVTESDSDKIPHASTWLNQARYEDDPKAWQTPLTDRQTKSHQTPEEEELPYVDLPRARKPRRSEPVAPGGANQYPASQPSDLRTDAMDGQQGDDE